MVEHCNTLLNFPPSTKENAHNDVFNTHHDAWWFINAVINPHRLCVVQLRLFEHNCCSPPLQGRGFSKAMTAKEAQAFVGDVSCLVNTLQDDKLFLDPPPTPPRARSRRHRRDTRPELLDLMVRSLEILLKWKYVNLKNIGK